MELPVSLLTVLVAVGSGKTPSAPLCLAMTAAVLSVGGIFMAAPFVTAATKLKTTDCATLQNNVKTAASCWFRTKFCHAANLQMSSIINNIHNGATSIQQLLLL